MIVAHFVDATVAVALDDRAIGAERARLPRFAHAPAAEDHFAIRIFVVCSHDEVVASCGANNLAHRAKSPLETRT